MTKTMNHSSCTHPATKAGRAKCRRLHAAQALDEATAYADCAATIRYAYYNGDADADELLGLIHSLGIDINADLSLEELINSL